MAVSARPAPAPCARRPAARQHPVPDEEIDGVEASSLPSRYDEATSPTPACERGRDGRFRERNCRTRSARPEIGGWNGRAAAAASMLVVRLRLNILQSIEIRLFEIASLTGLNELVERLDLAVQSTI